MSKKEKKIKKTRDAGYVPFTREDLNQHETENRNVRAVQLFQEMLDIPKRVLKKKKKGKEIEVDDFYPTTMEEAIKMENMLVQVEAAIDDRSDNEFMENIAWMKETLVWSKKRQWTIAWWIVAVVFCMSLYYFNGAKKGVAERQKVERWNTEQIEGRRTAEIQSIKNSITWSQESLANAESKEDTKHYSKRLAANEKELKAIEAMDTEKYHKREIKQYNKRAWAKRWSAFWCLFWVGLYIVAQRPYGYMVSRRRTEAAVYGGLQKALFGVVGALMGAAASMKVTEYVTTYSDGSKESSNDAMVILALQLMFMAAAVALIVVVARVVIVIAAIMGLFRNYELIPILKKILNKNK